MTVEVSLFSRTARRTRCIPGMSSRTAWRTTRSTSLAQRPELPLAQKLLQVVRDLPEAGRHLQGLAPFLHGDFAVAVASRNSGLVRSRRATTGYSSRSSTAPRHRASSAAAADGLRRRASTCSMGGALANASALGAIHNET